MFRQRPFIILFLICGLASILYSGCVSFWTDSEMWNAVAVKYLFSNQPFYDFSLKPLFNLILWFNFEFAEAIGVHPMTSGRVLFALNSSLVIYLFFRLARVLTREFRTALLLTALLASNSFFVKRFSHVRSDALVTSLVLGLMCLRYSGWWARRTSVMRHVVFLVFFSVAMLITPKAIFLMGFWALCFLRFDTGSLESRTRVFMGSLIWACFLCTPYFVHLPSPQFFINSFTWNPELPYWSWHRMEHVVRFLMENSLLLLLLPLNIYCGTALRRRLDKETVSFFDFANLTLLLLILFPDRLPFFVAALAPFFYLPLAALWPSLTALPYFQRLGWPRLSRVLWMFCFLCGGYWSAFLILSHNSTPQRTFISWLDQQATHDAGLSIYDPVGVLPFDHVFHWFVGPAEPANLEVTKSIERFDVDLVFFTPRLFLLGSEAMGYLQKNYWQDQAGIFIRKYDFKPAKQQVAIADLTSFLLEKMPALKEHPDRKIYLQLKTTTGIDLSRYGVWLTRDSEKKEFTNQVSLNDLAGYKTLALPPTVDTVMALPIHLRTPFDAKWIDLFGFDPEI